MENMELYESRLATFKAQPTTGRKRASTTKGGKGGKWALRSPSPEQLAQAGFYYAPTGAGSDNVTCFCCEKSLDGWEEGDNPFSEHLHFSSDCAWAILMAIENDASEELKKEDPMSERMIEARRQTYKDQWPHEKKRGWTCKVQKMVEGGWYFCPSPEGDDQANCVYCQKSLWGWEPKDKPYDEHLKRSPGCAFFTGSKPAAKGRKARVSKASRVSSQSTVTFDIDESVDPSQAVDETQASMMTVDMSMASTTAKGKKGTKAKKTTAKSTRSKTAAVSSAQDEEMAESEPAPSARTTRGKKRASNQMLEDSIQVIEPPKKRATRNRASSVQPVSRETSMIQPDVMMEDPDHSIMSAKTGGKGGRKRAASATRKPSQRIASTQSTASQASLRVTVPADDEIDAALEADLERFESDDDSDNWKVLGKDDSVVSQIYAPQSTRTSNIKASTAKTRGKGNGSVIEDRSVDIIMEDAVHNVVQAAVPTIAAVKKTKGKAGRKPKQSVSIDVEAGIQQVKAMDIQEFEKSLEAEDEENFVSVLEDRQASGIVEEQPAGKFQETPADDSGHETDGSVLAHNKAKRQSKKAKEPAKPKQATRKVSAKSKAIKKKSHENTFQMPADVEDHNVSKELEAMQQASTRSEAVLAPHVDVTLGLTEAPTPRHHTSIQHQMKSPEASPQGSDAENQPPSSRPSQTRPPLARYSPTGARTVRIALPPSTPTASPSKRNARLETTYPWAPADIEYILTGTPAASNKENVDLKNLLSNEEKRMTLEEWINWNAKKNEDRLKAECERMVGKFENEGVRALKTLEGIVCCDS